MARREERFQMRQRGAGSRDIQLSFDLELPGLPKLSISPLLPRKSAGSKSALQPDDLSPPKHPTPKVRKSKPAISLKRNPARAGRGKINTAEEEVKSLRKKPLESSSMSVTNRQVARDVATRKRKLAPGILDGTDEGTRLASPKKKRKRRSIGQQSMGRKAKVPVKPRATREGAGSTGKVAGSTNDDAAGELKTSGVPVEALDEVVQNSEPKEACVSNSVPDAPRIPKRKKRRSIGQDQRSKKKPKLTAQELAQVKEAEMTTDAEENGS
ncbi:MAG: hypothetical protein Q9174_006052, partial [Haloplaca sp. 1 TL-2023]